MTSPFRDRVRESATTTGTGSFTLTGTSSGYQTFLGAGYQTGDTLYYTMTLESAGQWEVGLGTFTAPSTIARSTVLASSNSGAKVNFSEGTKYVFVDLPADYLNTLGTGNNLVTAADVRTYGVDGSGDSADLAGWELALETGGELYVPAGTYDIPSIVTATLTKDVRITFAPGAKVVGTAALTTQAFRILGASKAYSFHVIGGEFDMSAVVNASISGDTGTVFDLYQVKTASFRGCVAYAGGDYSDGFGDTFVDNVDCGLTLIDGCDITGFADSGIYASGDSGTGDSDNGGPTIVRNSVIRGCAAAITSKRMAESLHVTNCRLSGCSSGITLEVVGSGEVKPGQWPIIVGNHIEDCGLPIDFRGPSRGIIANNIIADFGYSPASGAMIADAKAIRLSGAINTTVSGNTISMRNRSAPTSGVGILLVNDTIGATSYTTQHNLIASNIIKGITYGIYEGASVGLNTYSENAFPSTTTPYTLTSASSVAPVWQRSPLIAGTLSGIGSVAALTVSSTVSVACPGAAVGDDVSVTYLNSIEPRIQIHARAATDLVQIGIYNGTGSTIDFSTHVFTVVVRRHVK